MSIKVSYLPSSDAAKVIWFNNFSVKIGTYAASLGITVQEVESIHKDKNFYEYIITMVEVYKQNLNFLVGYKNSFMHYTDQQQLGSLMQAPALIIPTEELNGGAFDRLSKMIHRIKSSANYNAVIGIDLGIVAPVSRVERKEMRPVLRIKLNAGRPVIKSTKGIAEAIDLYVNRNDGNDFILLGRFLKTEYTDIAELPASTPLAEWKYKAMFVIGNDNVGLMSVVESVMVKRL